MAALCCPSDKNHLELIRHYAPQFIRGHFILVANINDWKTEIFSLFPAAYLLPRLNYFVHVLQSLFLDLYPAESFKKSLWETRIKLDIFKMVNYLLLHKDFTL